MHIMHIRVYASVAEKLDFYCEYCGEGLGEGREILRMHDDDSPYCGADCVRAQVAIWAPADADLVLDY